VRQRPEPPELRLHRRQFLIGPEPVLARDDWRTVEVAAELYLTHCPKLPVRRTAAGLVLGIAIPTEPDGVEMSWMGRWVLVRDRALELDVGGLLGCFYRTTPSGLWASSSPEILRGLPPELPLPPHRLVHAKDMDWYPPPRSGIDSVLRLLPTQTLDLRDGALAPRPLLPPIPAFTYEDVLASAERRLTGAIAKLARVYDEVWIALTGGADSRLVLAAAHATGLCPTTFTFIRANLKDADRYLPPKIAQALGLDHRAIPYRTPHSEALQLFDRHTARHTVDEPRTTVCAGLWDEIPRSALVLGGGNFEAARGRYYDRLPADMPGTAEATAELILSLHPSTVPMGIHEWAAWLHATHDGAHDWRDRFYIEQKMAGWRSSLTQGVDLAGRDQVLPANCSNLLAELLAVPAELRADAVHYRDLIARMAPPLADFPVNPPMSLARRLRRKIRTLSSPLRGA
jgi:hypothetical protein